MYEGWNLSPNLKPGWVEIVVEKYDAGNVTRLFDVLVPEKRLNQSQYEPLLRSLFCRFDGPGFEQIISAHLNKRKKGPPYASNPFPTRIEHPEPGVRRTYCGRQNPILAWIDWVAIPESYRKERQGKA